MITPMRRAGAAGPLDDLTVDLGVVLLEAAADEHQRATLPLGLVGVRDG
ncbi:hypothetical protein LUR56_00180 [Streptomyces sp. MT29]|nr:hypothetical protein [Streptomyces sp. MT29]